MVRVLIVGQDKGGVGKSLLVRALAEAVPAAPIIEVDSTRRLVELEDRVMFFSMRAERIDIERSGGKAARAEFDGVINAMWTATVPTIVDVGANTARSLLTVLSGMTEDFAERNVELGVLVIVTAEPGAMAEAPRIMKIAKDAGATRFLLENRLQGPVNAADLKKIADGAPTSALDEHVMEDEAVRLLQIGGLASIPNLDPARLNEAHGVAAGSRIRRDLTRLRAAAMEAARRPASWLVGEA